MSQAPSVALAETTEDSHADAAANVALRGTARGLEILITGTPTTSALGARLSELLAEAPGFFAGSNARVAIDGMLPVGALACLEEIATRFDLRLVEIGPAAARRLRGELAAMPPIPPVPAGLTEPSRGKPGDSAESSPGETPGDAATKAASTSRATDDAAVIAPSVADGSGGAVVDPVSGPELSGDAAAKAASTTELAVSAVSAPEPSNRAAVAAAATAEPAAAEPAGDSSLVAALAAVLVTAGAREAAAAAVALAAAAAAAAADDEAPIGPRLVVGPVRSGRIVDHVGHVIVVGDVNPGAEVRAEGSIIVLGRLRGVAHAAIGRDKGCIIALSLQPQQLRIGRMVARAGDADRPGGGAEIAYVTGETIVVDRFSGRLPSGLAASM